MDRSFAELTDKERAELAELYAIGERLRDLGDREAAAVLFRARLELARLMMFPDRPLMS